MKWSALKKKTISLIIPSLLIGSFVLAPVSETLQVQKVTGMEVIDIGANGQLGGLNAQMQTAVQTNYAQLSTELKTTAESTNNVFQSTLSAIADTLQAGLQSALNVKELTLDNVAWALANIMLKEMIRSTTKWVNSGFQGSPAFVTDLDGFMTDIGDKVAGNFIKGTPLGLLCAPFKFKIQYALQYQYERTQGYRAQCRLSSVVKNLQRFTQGDFIAGGGWDAWYEVALNNSLNPYGTLYEAQAGLSASIVNARGQELKLLEFGSGFLSMKKCDTVHVDNPDGTGESANGRYMTQKCVNTTPGVVIQNQLNKAIGSSQDRLVVADELNELIGAFMNQMVSQALGGVGGLLGASQPEYGGGSSYFSRMSEISEKENDSSSFGGLILEQVSMANEYLTSLDTVVRMVPDDILQKGTKSTITTSTSTVNLATIQKSQCETTLNNILKGYALATSEYNWARTYLEHVRVLYADYMTVASSTQADSSASWSLTPDQDAVIAKYNVGYAIDPSKRDVNLARAKNSIIATYTSLSKSGNIITQSTLDTMKQATIPKMQQDVSYYKEKCNQ